MNNQLANLPMKKLVQQNAIQDMMKRTLGSKAQQFTTSLVNIVNSNQQLKNVDQMSVIQSAMVAASLDLPIDPNLGYMWLVPYGHSATPQIGYKGYIQLAQRTGQYKAMNAVVVHEGELVSWNPLSEEVVFDPMKRTSDEVIGYVGYFRLLNGFEKTVYWSKDQMEDHRKRFVKGGGGQDKPTGVWGTDYDAMALKTVIRGLLSKWGPMSVQMAEAIKADDKEPQNERQSIDGDVNEFTDETAASKTTEQMLDEFIKEQTDEPETVDVNEHNKDDQKQGELLDEVTNQPKEQQLLLK